jgi:hypothetical protein
MFGMLPYIAMAASLQDVVQAALRRRKNMDICVTGHGFVIKPAAQTERGGESLAVEAKVRHERFGQDDHSAYKIHKVNGDIKDVDIEIKKVGVFSSLPNSVQFDVDKGPEYATGGLASGSEFEKIASRRDQ